MWGKSNGYSYIQVKFKVPLAKIPLIQLQGLVDKYKKEFKSVKAELKSGQFEELFWKPLELWGNPDSAGPRQHWRSRNKCGQFKDKALIIADDGYQACRFVLPGSACKRWE